MFNTKGLNGESYLDYFSTEKSLYYLTDCNLRQYDLQNSKVINCSNKIYKTCDVSDYRYAKFLSASSDGNDILICSNKGVIKYSQNTNKKSMIINGRNTSFGLEDMHLLSFEKIDSNNYIALFSDDENNYYINSYSSKNKTKNKEVKIYSLYEINKENLTSFLKEIKYIKNKYTDTDMNTNELLNSCLKYKCDGIIFMLQDTDFDIGNIASITEYAYVNDISKSSKLEYSLLGTSNINYFIPETIVSVCSKSKNTEECSKFIKYLLSSEFEKINYESGFSINKTALMEEYNEMDSADPISGITTYKGNSIDIYKPSLDSINNLISNINLLEKIQYMFILNS